MTAMERNALRPQSDQIRDGEDDPDGDQEYLRCAQNGLHGVLLKFDVCNEMGRQVLHDDHHGSSGRHGFQ